MILEAKKSSEYKSLQKKNIEKKIEKKNQKKKREKVSRKSQSIFQWQQEYLGYISYKDETKKNVGYVLDVNTKYSPKITVYAIDKGTTEVYKMPKKSYEKQPFNKGYLISFHYEQRPKSKLVDGQWQKDYSVMEKWITNYILNVAIQLLTNQQTYAIIQNTVER